MPNKYNRRGMVGGAVGLALGACYAVSIPEMLLNTIAARNDRVRAGFFIAAK